MITIENGNIDDCLKIQDLIPEFSNNKYDINEYQKRTSNIPHLILIAKHKNKLAGFKVGYQKNEDFYSWMGGVIPKFRKLQIAKSLAEAQEKWAVENGFKTIVFKTRNSLKPMLIFALENGFNIIEVINHKNLLDNRIILKKELS